MTGGIQNSNTAEGALKSLLMQYLDIYCTT